MSGWRVDLHGRQRDRPERIGLHIATGGKAYTFDFDPADALELAATIADTYALHKRWIEAREHDSEPPTPTPRTGLDVESYRLLTLLESGYGVETAERLAKDATVDLHKAEQLAKDAGPKLAAEILT